MHQERNPATESIIGSDSGFTEQDARQFCDPESGSSSGATHAPSQPSTILSPTTAPRCVSGLPRETRNFYGYFRKHLWPATCSRRTIFHIPQQFKNLASSSQGLRPDLTGSTRKQESEMRREPRKSSILTSQCARSLLVSSCCRHLHLIAHHIAWLKLCACLTSSMHVVSVTLRLWVLHSIQLPLLLIPLQSPADPAALLPPSMRTVVTLRTPPKRWWSTDESYLPTKPIDELMTLRLIVVRRDFHDFDVFDAMIAKALRRLLDKHIHFRKSVSVGEQRAQNSDRFFRGRQIAHTANFRATEADEAAQGVSDLFTVSLQNDDV